MSIKFLIFLGLCYLLYRYGKRAIKKKIARFLDPFLPPQPPQPPEEKLIQCAVCGAFVAEQQSKFKGGKHYCSLACLQKEG